MSETVSSISSVEPEFKETSMKEKSSKELKRKIDWLGCTKSQIEALLIEHGEKP